MNRQRKLRSELTRCLARAQAIRKLLRAETTSGTLRKKLRQWRSMVELRAAMPEMDERTLAQLLSRWVRWRDVERRGSRGSYEYRLKGKRRRELSK